MIELIGSFAGFCTTVSFIPQVYRVWKTHSVHDISLSMYLIFCTGVASWTIYGIYKEAYPLIFFNAATLVLALAILWMKLLWGNPKSCENEENSTVH